MLSVVEPASRAHVGIVVKLGGSEALTDIRLAKMLGATAILEPMIESKFALENIWNCAGEHSVTKTM